jgi:uncharacterized protein (TIGR01619 family)
MKMSDQWNFYPLRVDGEPASVFVDLGIAAAPPMESFPIMGYLRLKMNFPREDGLSSQGEYDTLIALENGIEKWIGDEDACIYVGRNTSGGHRDFYFYSSDHNIQSKLQNFMRNWKDYKFQTGSRPDPAWSTYWNFLYPSPEDLQRMGNRDVIDCLIENGDKIDLPRKIDHFSIFETKNDREQFIEDIRVEGYVVAGVADTENGDFTVEFERIDRPDQIDGITIDLFRKSLARGGTYDGWGCLTAS